MPLMGSSKFDLLIYLNFGSFSHKAGRGYLKTLFLVILNSAMRNY
jgi:hypothetical protein